MVQYKLEDDDEAYFEIGVRLNQKKKDLIFKYKIQKKYFLYKNKKDWVSFKKKFLNFDYFFEDKFSTLRINIKSFAFTKSKKVTV